MSTPAEQAQIAYRDQVNWRSVTRADPSVQQIINTCTFCSVFIFDKQQDEWVKQKQEGPLFLVRRNKAPEYGLYMLNRATVKNPLWPLIPNEMRVTPTTDDMLIVERRGEGIKTGIHFGDGKAVVEAFRSSIIDICGDPRAKAGSAPPTLPPSQSQPPSQAPVQPQQRALAQSTPSSSSSAQPVDDLSRLFSGILAAPSSSSRSSSAAAPPPAQHVGRNGNSWEQSASSSSNSRPDEITNINTKQTTTNHTPHRSATPPSPPITFSEMPVSPTNPSRSPHPPGQTVADLLNSIGGFAFPTPGPAPGPAHPLLSPSRNPIPQTQVPAPPSIPTHPLLSPPPPAPTHPLLPPTTHHLPPQQAMRTPPPPPQVQASRLPGEGGQRPRDRPPHLDAPAIPPAQQAPGQQGVNHIQAAILDTLPMTYQSMGPDPKVAFQRDLIDMIQRDPIFVDQLFHAYLARRS